MSATDVAALISRCRFRYTDEIRLHEGIAAALAAAGVAFEREVALSPLDRIDFLVGDVGVEVKVAGAASRVDRQLARYAKHDRVAALILVTDREQAAAVRNCLNGKPVLVVRLRGGLA